MLFQQDWMNDRACTGEDPKDFDCPPGEEPHSGKAKAAKLVCRGCDVQAKCLEWGLNDYFNIFGGLVPKERATLRKERNRLARQLPIAG